LIEFPWNRELRPLADRFNRAATQEDGCIGLARSPFEHRRVGADFHCSRPRHQGASSLSSSVGVSWSERTTETTVRLPDYVPSTEASTHVLLDRYDDRLAGAEVVLVPALASFVMVMWDLCIDPASSTISGSWIWRDGGGYFGVPLVNFLGWYLCVFTIYLMFALYLQRSAEWTRATNLGDRSTWTLPALMYAAVMLPRLLEPAVSDSVQVTSNDGHVWWTGDIHAASALVALFTMLFVTVLALVRVSRNPALH
jgi:hypothetical protein